MSKRFKFDDEDHGYEDDWNEDRQYREKSRDRRRAKKAKQWDREDALDGEAYY